MELSGNEHGRPMMVGRGVLNGNDEEVGWWEEERGSGMPSWAESADPARPKSAQLGRDVLVPGSFRGPPCLSTPSSATGGGR